jgi:cell wall assembly regulator SMI1
VIQVWVQTTKEAWLSQRIKLKPGTQHETIEATETAVGFNFPTEMSALYQMVNGFKDWDWTKGMICLWPGQGSIKATMNSIRSPLPLFK